MIHLFKTCMITAFILGLTWSAPLRAQDQRYISIRNTDTIWLPGNICAYYREVNHLILLKNPGGKWIKRDLMG